MAANTVPLVLVGTMKGAFLLRPDRARKRWQMEGPYLKGHAVYAMALDNRAGRQRLFATAMNSHFGTVLASSDDLGKSWKIPEEPNVTFPEGSELALKQIWQITPGPADQPDVLYCGVEPAALFKTTDAGESWTPVQGLLDHPHRKQWMPGGGGLCLHTIVQDATNSDRMLVAISAGGAYRTDDGGMSWRASNKGVRAEFMPDKHPEFGQCVHKVVNHPSRPERLFLQNHWGLYRSDDWGDSWQDIANGVPSDFGFAMAMHPHDPDTVYILPIEADVFRVVPEAKLRVYRTRDAGASWHPLTKGLPQESAYECVLRDSMAVDRAETAGVYFGTRSGKVFLAAPLAALDAGLRPERTARVRARLFQAHGGHTDGTAELRAIWFARIARECLRVLLALGFTDAVLRRIEVIGATASRGSCIYAIYHTPWGRTLALWMARQSDGLVFSAGRWLDRAGKAHVPCTWRGLRELVRRIRHGAAAAVTADHFGPPGDDHSTTASILGRDVQVSTGVARIALAAGVPIVPVLTRYRAGKLQVVIGGEINVAQGAVADATRRMTAAFDAELRRDPSGWEQAHRFLSVAPDEPR